MKSPSLFRICCLFALIVLVSPVDANPVLPSVWKIHFSKDGIPYNESVDFSIKCYGFFQENHGHGIIVTYSPNHKNGTEGPGLVFSRSASCPYYGCPVTVSMSFQDFDSKWCNLEGETRGKKFIIRNYSTQPLEGPGSCRFIEKPYDTTGVRVLADKKKFYNFTPEYRACMEKIQNLNETCNQYGFEREEKNDKKMNPVSPSSDIGMKNISVYNLCRASYDNEKIKCNQYLTDVDRSDIVVLDGGYTTFYTCSLNFSIPSSDLSSEKFPESEQSSYILQSPVESLYCGILRLFGGRCE